MHWTNLTSKGISLCSANGFTQLPTFVSDESIRIVTRESESLNSFHKVDFPFFVQRLQFRAKFAPHKEVCTQLWTHGVTQFPTQKAPNVEILNSCKHNFANFYICTLELTHKQWFIKLDDYTAY